MDSNNLEDLEHRNHCDKCYNSVQCIKLNSLKGDVHTKIIKCPIVRCRFNCEQVFHICKQNEHESLCQNVKVPCINSNYGCPMFMERKLTAKHLEKCPASVVVCTMEWNRWPLPPGGRRPFEMLDDSTQLDVAFLQRDERTVRDWKLLPKKLRNAMKTRLTDLHPSMPLGVSGQRIPRSIMTEKLVQTNDDGTVTEEVSESEHDSNNSDTPWGSKRSPPGLVKSVCNKLATCEEDSSKTQSNSNLNDNNNFDEEESQNTSNLPPQPPADSSGKTFLNLVVDVMPRPKLKPRDMFTFLCGREFRRDEYSNHFLHLHGLLSQLNGQWLYRRCPMSNEGCSFGVDRMTPYGSDHRLIYNKALDSFCFTQVMNQPDTVDNKTEPEEEMLSLCDMPFEVLVNLTLYLDPLSLNALSMTSLLLREVCQFVVVNRGIVVLQWEKFDNSKKWEVHCKKWLFSTSFSPIRKWSFGDIAHISNHMKTCSHYDRNIADKPFKYPVSVSDL